MANPSSNKNSILFSLIEVSEKAANIARICRQDGHLLSLLVQEKKETEKNPRYVHDFKTLADVLVQEVVKHDLGKKYPSLIGQIFGEENNEFIAGDETVTIEVKPTVDETSLLLSKILPDDEASKILAQVVHSSPEVEAACCDVEVSELPSSIGVWIDPIDSTVEYISGKTSEHDGKIKSGLSCVTVLLGLFDRVSGDPLIGVINQPFYSVDGEGWIGRYVYGVCINDFKISNPRYALNQNEKSIAVSSSENDEIKHKLSQNGFNIVEVAGAGYKLLNIITGDVYGYVLSKPTTYMWDICAGHAILRAIGGDIIDFTSLEPVKYKGGVGVKDCCNNGGIIAFRDPVIKQSLIDSLGLAAK